MITYGLKLKVVKVADQATVRINHMAQGSKSARQRFLREAAKTTAEAIAGRISQGPYADRLLANRILTRTKAFASGDSYSIQVAPFSEVGDPSLPAPRNTIKEFLAGPGTQYKNVVELPSGETRQGFIPRFNPRFAWMYLPSQAKRELNALRQTGQYGGAQNGRVVPAYWYMQEVGTYPMPNPRAQRFIQDGVAEAQAKLGTLVLEFVRSA